MKKSTGKKNPLVLDAGSVHDQGVGLEQQPREGAGMGFSWAWPPQMNNSDAEKYVPGDWGCVYLRPATQNEPADVMIKFAASLDARRKALAFAQALVARLQHERPGARTEFYTADDHYHVVVDDFGSAEQRLAAGILGTFGKRGLLSGKRSGRPGYTFTHETHERHVTRRR